MRDKRAIMFIGGGVCLLIVLAGVVVIVIDLTSGRTPASSLVNGTLGLLVLVGIIAVGLRETSRS